MKIEQKLQRRQDQLQIKEGSAVAPSSGAGATAPGSYYRAAGKKRTGYELVSKAIINLPTYIY